MKICAIVFSLLFFAFIIENIELSSFHDNINQDRKDSYEACIKLKAKAPYFNLKCDIFLDYQNEERDIENKIFEKDEYKIKILYMDKTETRKVNESEEIKLRNLIKKLSDENILKFK